MITDGERLLEIASADRFREFTMSELAAIHHFDVEAFWSLKTRYRFISYSNQNLCLLNSFIELGRSLDRVLASKHLALVQAIDYLPDSRFDERCDHDDGDMRTVFIVEADHMIDEVPVPWASSVYMLHSRYLSDLFQKKKAHDTHDVDEEISKVAAYHQEFIKSEGYMKHIDVMLEAAKLNYMLPSKKSEREKVLKI